MAKRLPWVQLFSGTEAGIRAAERIVGLMRGTLHNEDRVPRTGGALVVSNHSFGGYDAVAISALLVLRTGRMPRFLGERNLWKIPGAGLILDALGTIPGSPDDAVRLLREGELVIVYPGGVDDSFKLSHEAYQLKWKDRAGFAKVALQAGVPIVPIAATGVDEIFELPRRERLIGRLLLGSPRYDIPIPRNVVPRRVPLDYYVLPNVMPEGDPSDPEAIERARRATHDAIEGVLAGYRERLGNTEGP